MKNARFTGSPTLNALGSGPVLCPAGIRLPHAVIVAVHILAFAPIAAQGMSCRKSLFYADLKHVSPELRYTIAADLPESWPIRKDLPIWHLAARRRRSNRESGQHRPIRALSRIAAVTPGKFYHRASAGDGCPAAQARRGLFSPGSSAQIPASTTARPAALGIPQTGCAHLLEERGLAPTQWGHSPPQMAVGR